VGALTRRLLRRLCEGPLPAWQDRWASVV